MGIAFCASTSRMITFGSNDAAISQTHIYMEGASPGFQWSTWCSPQFNCVSPTGRNPAGMASYPSGGSDARKTIVMDQMTKLKRDLGNMSKAQRDALLDDIWSLASDKAVGVENAEALETVREQVQALKALP